jgi:ribonuclease Z
MDHFIGFDQMLRVCLGRDRRIFLYGPPGFLEQIENKLKAYTWNLVENYTNDFALVVTEVNPESRKSRIFDCHTAFRAGEVIEGRYDGILMDNRHFFIKGTFLDHKIPCLAFRFEEKNRVNIKKTALVEMGLPTGAWLMTLREHVLNDDPDETEVRVWWKDENKLIKEKCIPLGELRNSIVKVTTGQCIAYITDVLYSEDNINRIVDLAKGADHLFIEATFLEEDADKAAQKYHLTAKQAGTLAGMAGVKRLTLFHYSPKYKSCAQRLTDEAMAAFYG